MRVAGVFVGVLLFGLLGVFLAVRYSEHGRTERLEKCIGEKRILMEDGLKEIGLSLGDPEIWLAHPESEEFATFPIEGEKAGAPKRFFRVHTGVDTPGGTPYCRAGFIDGN